MTQLDEDENILCKVRSIEISFVVFILLGSWYSQFPHVFLANFPFSNITHDTTTIFAVGSDSVALKWRTGKIWVEDDVVIQMNEYVILFFSPGVPILDKTSSSWLYCLGSLQRFSSSHWMQWTLISSKYSFSVLCFLLLFCMHARFQLILTTSFMA